MQSKFLSLGKNDLIKGLIVTVLTALVSGLIVILNSSEPSFDWLHLKPIVIASIAAGLSYLTKNLLTNSDGQPLTMEDPLKYGK